jgi:hypothetical protein
MIRRGGAPKFSKDFNIYIYIYIRNGMLNHVSNCIHITGLVVCGLQR